jgi:hypothetical protein
MDETAQIFLCYAREDEKRVEELYQKLTDSGFKPWMDKKDILPGETWKNRVQEAIESADFVLVCLSTNSIKRGFVQKEIYFALDMWQEKLEDDIYLIPVRLEDCKVPKRLREFQWVNLFEPNGWTRLVKAIQVGMERWTEVPTDEEPPPEAMAMPVVTPPPTEPAPAPAPVQPASLWTWVAGIGTVVVVVIVLAIALMSRGQSPLTSAPEAAALALTATPTTAPTETPTSVPPTSTPPTPTHTPTIPPTDTPTPTHTPTTPPTDTPTPTQTPVPPTATANYTPRPPALTPTPTAPSPSTGPIALTIYLRGTRTETGFAALSDDQVNGGMVYEEGKFVYGEAAVQIGDAIYHFDKPEVGPGEPEQLPDPWRVEFEFAKALVERTGSQAGFNAKKAQFWVGALDGDSAVGEDNPYSLTMKLYEGDELRKSIQVFFAVADVPGGGGSSGGGGEKSTPSLP